MAPRSGALIAGITRFVEDVTETRDAVTDMAKQGVDVVSDPVCVSRFPLNVWFYR